MALSIIGAGKIGIGLATLASENGINVRVGSRHPDDARFKTAVCPVIPIQDALDDGDIVVFAIPHAAIEEMIQQYGPLKHGTVVIDTANSVDFSDLQRLHSGLDIPHGAWLQNLLPQCHVVRAFNHIQDELLVSRAHRTPGIYACAIAGDDEDAKKTVAELVTSLGYVPVDAGNLEESAVLEPGGPLFPHMFLPGDMADAIAQYQAAQ